MAWDHIPTSFETDSGVKTAQAPLSPAPSVGIGTPTDAQVKTLGTEAISSAAKTTQISTGNECFNKVSNHKILELNNTNVKKKISYVLTFLIFAGIVAATIGLGGLLGNPDFHIPTDYTIQGIPLDASIALLAVGGFFALIWPALKIASKIKEKREKASKLNNELAECYKDYNKIRDKGFIDSNLNDFLGVAAFLLIAIRITLSITANDPHFSDIKTAEGCLQYPFGFLLVGSGLIQIGISIRELRKALKEKNKEEIALQITNIINSLILMGLGGLAVGGQITGELSKIGNLVSGAISLGVGLYQFIKYSVKKYKKISEVKNENNLNEIYSYLRNTFEAYPSNINDNLEEFRKVVTPKTYIKTIKIYQILSKIREKYNQIDLNSITEEDIKKAIDDLKIEVEKYKDGKDEEFSRAAIIENFKAIRSQIKCKIAFESVKLIMFAGFTTTSAISLNMSTDNSSFYAYSQAALSLLSLIPNLVPRFRNVAPDVPKLPEEDAQKETAPKPSGLQPVPVPVPA